MRSVAAVRLGLMLVVALAAALPVGAELTDPMRPPAAYRVVPDAAPAQAPAWVLHSTLIAADRRTAVINGQTVREGQMVDGARVMIIEPGRVTLRRDRKHFEIDVSSLSVKSPAKP